MTLEEVYGTRPDLLPRSMVRVVRGDQSHGRRIAWAGRSGVKLLDLAEHLEYERKSLRAFPRGSDGAIVWGSVTRDVVLYSADSDSIDFCRILEEYAPSAGTLIFFWGSLAIPTVEMEFDSTRSHLSEIAESKPEFWIYSPGDRVVLEKSFSGVLTVAQVPANLNGPHSA